MKISDSELELISGILKGCKVINAVRTRKIANTSKKRLKLSKADTFTSEQITELYRLFTSFLDRKDFELYNFDLKINRALSDLNEKKKNVDYISLICRRNYDNSQNVR